MKYKLVALDIDGTLLNDDYRISEQTRETINSYVSSGGQIVLCTGRGPVNTLPILEELGSDGIIITHNGAVTVQSEDRAILFQYPFTMKEALPYIEYCRRHEIHFDICTPFHMYMEKVTEEEQRMYEKYMLCPELVGDISVMDEAFVKLTVFGSRQQMDQTEEDWKGMKHNLRIIRSGDFFIDVMSTSATKGNALKELAELWNLKADEIAAMGNYFNDIEMIKYAGLGIAMDNSPKEVKEAADAVTLSNNDEGVHAAFHKHILKGDTGQSIQ
jgi:Cof subfamily protein (haloacid dehalogenase superfamily)